MFKPLTTPHKPMFIRYTLTLPTALPTDIEMILFSPPLTGSFTRRASSQTEVRWRPEEIRDFYQPSSVSDLTASRNQRKFRGVHGRDNRRKGTTPAEAEKFNSILANIFADLERTNGPLQPGSSTSDPYGASLSMGASMVRARKFGLFDRPENLGQLDSKSIEELESLKEQVSTLSSDLEVFEWSKKNVFKFDLSDTGELSYSPTYPHILAFTIKLLRLNFNNPHLGLALFQHAQTVNVESYMFGCLTDVYNEVIQIRWDSFKDLNGVEAAIREMDLNGLEFDKQTNSIIRNITTQIATHVAQGLDLNVIYGHGAETKYRQLEDRLTRDIDRQWRISKKKSESKRQSNDLAVNKSLSDLSGRLTGSAGPSTDGIVKRPTRRWNPASQSEEPPTSIWPRERERQRSKFGLRA